VQRREPRELAQLGEYFAGHDGRLHEAGAAVNDAVTDGDDRLGAERALSLALLARGREQCGDDLVRGRRVIAPARRPRAAADSEHGTLAADSHERHARDAPQRVRGEQLRFQRGAPRVEHENAVHAWHRSRSVRRAG
jgi:hypothetical protein